MSHNPLLRFLNKQCGPIVRLSTRTCPIGDRYLYYSTAQLSEDITGGSLGDGILKPQGGGWSLNRQESQEKAIVEAVERWAFFQFSKNNICGAGLNVDYSTNGFAALPGSMGLNFALKHSLYESVERYLMIQFWERQNLPLIEISLDSSKLDLQSLFLEAKGTIRLFGLELNNLEPECPLLLHESTSAFFVISLFFRHVGGVVPGSACGDSLSKTLERAVLEMYNHLMAINCVEKGDLRPGTSMLDRRLVRFGTQNDAADEVNFVLEQNLELNKHKNSNDLVLPKILFSKQLSGPWEEKSKI